VIPMDSYSYTSAIATTALADLSQNGKSSPTSSIANTPADHKLRQAAGEFEGMLLSSLWKSMKSTFASSDDDSDDSTDPAHDSLDDMSIQAMSSAVGKAGGLGLAKLILKHLEPILAKTQIQEAAHSGKDSPSVADIH
jgi:Rod binding domain-containing protein